MPKSTEIRHSILILSASEQFDAVMRRSLKGQMMVEFRKSAATARQCFLERYYDLIVINTPLPDETGEQLAIEIAEQSNASVLLVVPAGIYENVLERVSDFGILVLSRPFPHGRLDKAFRFLVSIRDRMAVLERKIRKSEEKIEEIRIVDKAKLYLIERKHMTEEEAHRFIGKQAMDQGLTRKRTAELILDDDLM